MKVKSLSKKIESIVVKNQLYKPLLELLNVGLLLCERETLNVLYVNEIAGRFLNLESEQEIDNLTEILKEEEIKLLLQGNSISEALGVTDVKLQALIADQYMWISVTDCTDVVTMENASNRMMELNREFRAFFSEYGDENIVVANGNGIIEYAGEDIERTCGVENNYFVGKSVYEVEKNKIFYPSVTAKVLETKCTHVLLQKTQNNESLVSVGAPIFNIHGEIEKIVSVTKDFSEQIKIGSMLDNLDGQDSINFNQGFENFVTCSDSMAQLKWMVKLVAPTTSTILISGETGTGKEVVARNIAQLSLRKEQPFIKVNCGTISAAIVESELFGYEPGSFTGANREGKIGLIEAADGGTLFLDEISELPIEQQVKLLHVLQERMLIRVGGIKRTDLDIRVIVATNKNLEEQVKLGAFREDLYYRLNVVPIHIPPLRDRKEDIPILIKYFLEQFNIQHGKKKRISKNAVEMMQRYAWPGNVRELENSIERLVVTTQQNMINEDMLSDKIKINANRMQEGIEVNFVMELNEAIQQTERKLIEKALREYGTATKAAEVLGVNQSTISRKIKLYDLKESF